MNGSPTGNMYMRKFYNACVAALVLSGALTATAQILPDPVTIKVIAEVEVRTTGTGRQTTKLAPADRVAPGDLVLYTLEVRNTGTTTVPAPVVTNPVPAHMQYLPDSAVGPGTVVTYSVDGGRTFGSSEELKILGSDGQLQNAVAADYTHIRWKLRNSLKSNSVAFVRFRALVK
jgi:uncharacterized repeat protein (TIGR01451 family)